MKAWYLSLSQRERWIVLVGGVITALVLIWALVFEPVGATQTRLQIQAEKKTELLEWMNQASQQVHQLRHSNPTTNTSPQSTVQPQVAVNSALKTYKLDNASPSFSPQPNNRLRLSLKKASFDQFVRFLDFLETKHGLYADSFSLTPTGQTGIVDVRLTVQRQ